MTNKFSHSPLLEIVVFISGAAIMILELLASRIITPYLGSTIYSWSSLIGTIMLSLSLGYWLGGKIADKKVNPQILGKIILFSGFWIILIIIVKKSFLYLIVARLPNYFLNVLVASFLLFAPPSILLAMVSPIAAKLKLHNLKNTGKVIGNLTAISTIGSIIGTFLAGFLLIPYLGNDLILLLLASILLLISLILLAKNFVFYTIFLLVFITIFILLKKILYPLEIKLSQNVVSEINTHYNTYWIKKTKIREKTMLILQSDYCTAQATKILGDPYYLPQYYKYFRLGEYFNQKLKRVLIIGGGVNQFAQDLLRRNKTVLIDSVEIDPKMTEIAKTYFNFKKNPRLRIYYQDGRVFLRNRNIYDIIFVDAYIGFIPPFQLMTKEAVESLYSSLSSDGAVVINLISSIKGNNSQILYSQYKTYKSVFPKIYIFQISPKIPSTSYQNIILIALKKNQKNLNDNALYKKYANNLVKIEKNNFSPVLTDNYAPIDRYSINLLVACSKKLHFAF